MAKNEFDRDFDYEKESDFDPKAFLGTEEYDDDIDLSEFSDEELGLSSAEEAAEDDDVKEYIPPPQAEADEDEDLLVFPRREDAEEEVAEEAFSDGEEVIDQSVFDDESDYEEDGSEYDEESEYDEDSDEYDEDEDFQEEKAFGLG